MPQQPPVVRRIVALVATILATLILVACGGSDSPSSDADPDELLSVAQDTLVDAGTVQIELSSDGVPRGQDGVTAAKGAGVIDAAEPKFEGTITGTITGITGTIDVIAIGEEVWMKLFTPNYAPIDPAELGAPNPAMIFHPQDGLAGLLTQTTDASVGDSVREGSDVLTTVDGTIPAQAVYDVLKIGSEDGDYAISYGITDDNELRTVRIEGEFYDGATSTYSLTLTDYGTEVDITAP